MKTKHYTALASIIAGVTLASCAEQPQQRHTTSTHRVIREDGTRVYTQEELRNTGHENTARALERLDPAVTARGQ
jgi:hypothetical protein